MLREIVRCVHCHALALELSGALLSRGLVSPDDFRSTLDKKYSKVLSMSFRPSESTWKRAESVSKAFGMLYSELQKNNPTSAALLHVCAHYGTWAIETDLLSSAMVALSQGELLRDSDLRHQMPQDDFDLRKAINDLAEFSLIKVKRATGDNKPQIKIHGLLSRWCVECLDRKLEWAVLACACLTLIINQSISNV